MSPLHHMLTWLSVLAAKKAPATLAGGLGWQLQGYDFVLENIKEREGGPLLPWVTQERWIFDTTQNGGQHHCVQSGDSVAHSSRPKNLVVKQTTGLSTGLLPTENHLLFAPSHSQWQNPVPYSQSQPPP